MSTTFQRKHNRFFQLALAAGAMAVLFSYGQTVVRVLRNPLNEGNDVQLGLIWAAVCLAVYFSHFFGRHPRATLMWLGVESAAALLFAACSGHLSSLLITVGLVAVCAAWGDSALRAMGAVKMDDRLERFAIAAPLGLAILSLLVLVLLLTGHFSPVWARSMVLLFAAPQCPRLIRIARILYEKGFSATLYRFGMAPPETGIVLAMLGAALLFLLPWALAPEVQYDSLTYHLAVPKIWIEHHRIIDVPEVINSYFCHSAEALLGLGMILHDEAIAHLLTLSMGVLAALGTFALGRSLFDARRGLWAAALFLTTPLVLWLIGSTFIDVTVTMFGIAALVAWYRWASMDADGAATAPAGCLWAAGLLCGAAIGAKVTAALLFPLVLVYSCWRLLRHNYGTPRKRLKAAAGLCLALSVFLVPWLFVVYRFTGNPIFPFLGNIFGGRQASLTLAGAVSGYGIGTSFSALLRLPFAFTFRSQAFGEPMVDGAAGVSALLFLVFFLAAARKKRVPELVLLASAVVALVFFALRVQYARYLLPCYPLLAIFAVEGLLWASNGRPWVLAILGGFLCLQVPLVFPLYYQIPERIPFRLALGLESERHFSERAVEGQLVDDFLNSVTRSGDRVLSLDTDVLRFNLNVPMERPGTSTTDLNGTLGAPPGPELAAELLRRGFRWIVADAHGHETWPPMRSKQFLNRFGTLRFFKAGMSVYELCPAGCTPLPVGSNLLLDPGFEDLDDREAPQGWIAYGKPSVIVGHAHSGLRSVEGRPDDGYFQRVTIHPAHRYLLRHFSRALPAQSVRLQVNWTSADGSLVKADIEVVAATDSWLENQLNLEAPAGSAYAEVYVSTQQGVASFDDFLFAEIPPGH